MIIENAKTSRPSVCNAMEVLLVHEEIAAEFLPRLQKMLVTNRDTAQEKPQKGKIVAVGAGTKENPITVKVGDTVLYGKYAGTELKLEGKSYLIMRENDLLGILE